MNTITNVFDTILVKYTQKRTKLYDFKSILRGACHPTPLAK